MTCKDPSLGPAAPRPPATRSRTPSCGRVRAASAADDHRAPWRGSIEQRYAWFGELDAEHRSWVTLVARAGIDGFVAGSPRGRQRRSAQPSSTRRRAPCSATSRCSRPSSWCAPRSTRSSAQIEHAAAAATAGAAPGIVHYSREVAFAAAEVYARAAEVRGAWDARLEAMVVDAVIRGEADESVVSRASTLGWRPRGVVAVVVGDLPRPTRASAIDDPFDGR